MNQIRFEWDENKNRINIAKHNVSFEEAKTVFYDSGALVIEDPEHSEDEDRFIILGISRYANDEVIRIISARKANKQESKQYETMN